VARVLAGRYELEVPLGRGGFGEVWRGKDIATRRPVAVKIVELEEIDDASMLSETIARFRREATVIARLKHPNIVAALDAGRVDHELFLVMELAQGISLASMLEQRISRGMGLFPVASVLSIASQASTGLAAAHAAGVAHRDIKPSNLMVTTQLQIKIIDFGIARLLADNSPRLTLPSHMVGTPAYVSPEQARGGEVDGRADLYSLGCVLYELLSGYPPFRGPTVEAVLIMQLQDQPVPLGVIRPDLPAGLSELVGDLLQKNPAARPADATQVVGRLSAIAGTLDAHAPVHEVDRQTIRAADKPAADAGYPSEARRPTVLTPDRMAELAGPEAPAPPVQRAGGAAAGAAGMAVANPAPAQQAPRYGNGKASGAPAWPVAARSRRRRRRWRGALSTLLTAAIIAGVGIYVWERIHGTLKITSVAVALAQPQVGCNGTADVLGTIFTNGRAGSVTYQWIESTGQTSRVLTVKAASGSDSVLVQLRWAFNLTGTERAVAELRVLTPDQTSASTAFTFSCAS
jgi:Protein kinase domain